MRNIIIPLPFLPIWLSAPWVHIITRVPDTVARALAEGLRNDTIPTKNRFKEITGRDPLPTGLVLRQLADEMKN
jgi:hypothetical protein